MIAMIAAAVSEQIPGAYLQTISDRQR